MANKAISLEMRLLETKIVKVEVFLLHKPAQGEVDCLEAVEVWEELRILVEASLVEAEVVSYSHNLTLKRQGSMGTGGGNLFGGGGGIGGGQSQGLFGGGGGAGAGGSGGIFGGNQSSGGGGMLGMLGGGQSKYCIVSLDFLKLRSLFLSYICLT